jgi:PAS domain S-box-containing protein
VGTASAVKALSSLEGTALAEAIATRTTVTTREHPISRFRDWRHLHETRGISQFVICPLIGSKGAFGTLNFAWSTPEPPDPDYIAWSLQLATLVAAHLEIHSARSQLVELNAQLERRVDERTRALKQSEARFQDLFQHAPQAMIMVDESQRIVKANRAAQKLFDYTDDEFMGLPLSTLLSEESQPADGGFVESFFHEFAEFQATSAFFSPPHTRTRSRVIMACRRDGSSFRAEVGLAPVVSEEGSFVVAGIDDISARVAAQQELTASLREKETLLKEVHHRVKNNLQIISSLLTLQNEQSSNPEVRGPLLESASRVRSMALIHEQLYGAVSLAHIDFGQYAERLTRFLAGMLSPGAQLLVRTDPVELTIEVAVPCGLILNELVTNALKYGISPDGICRLRVQVTQEDGGFSLTVADSGPGLPAAMDVAAASTLGMQLLDALTRQLRATLEVIDSEGAELRLYVRDS